MTPAAIVVVFKKWTGYVAECVRAIENLRGGPYPLVLVPDGPVPEYVGSARVVVHAGSIAQKRNAGVGACPPEVPWVAFVDSDAWPRTDWMLGFQTRLDKLSSSLPVVCVTGPDLTPPLDPWTRRVTGYALASPLIMGRGSLRFRVSEKAVFVRNASTCNMFVRRDALSSVGGFDERLLTSEDVQLCQDLLSRGGAILFDPEIAVFHHRRDIPRFFLQWFNEGLALRHYRRFPAAGNFLQHLPSVLMLSEAALLFLGWTGLGLVMCLELGQYVVFYFDSLRRGTGAFLSHGVAFSMWLFVKAYGAGGMISYLFRPRKYVHSRCDH
ncbi:MAG TPA: hypothetical protein P5079_11095 [Elusimicrobiota bacterium]|nr:hypothetical protein [Elusimicrobiota bacterium]